MGQGLLELALAVSSRAVFVELIAYAASMTGVQLGQEGGGRFWGHAQLMMLLMRGSNKSLDFLKISFDRKRTAGVGEEEMKIRRQRHQGDKGIRDMSAATRDMPHMLQRKTC